MTDPASLPGPVGPTAPTGRSTAEREPQAIDSEFARLFRSRKADFIVGLDGEARCGIRQTGGAYLEGRFDLPDVDWDLPGCEPLIETFVIERDGSCTATGSDPRLIGAWLPSVERMSRRIGEVIAELAIELQSPAYLTASLSSLDEVIDTPHFDDDQYAPNDGVGFVAIVGSHAGTRIATEPIACGPLRPGFPVEVAASVLNSLASGQLAAQETAPERIVVFPQFGQLHAGPTVLPKTGSPEANSPQANSPQANSLRRLMVFRAQTVPAGDVGDGPT